MSYRGRKQGVYGNQPKRSRVSGHNRNSRFSRRDKRLATASFESRSARSQRQDLSKQAPIAPNLEVWLRSPATLDFPGVDVKLSANPVERRKQAEDLAQIATEKKLEVEVREPKSKKTVKRFRVLKKEEADKIRGQKAKAEKPENKKEEITQTEEVNSPLIKDQRMPSHEEILAKAQELYMHDNARYLELGENLPEECELREEGYLKRAQIELMTKNDTKATNQVLDYMGTLKNELEQIGFTIVPIEGFEL